MIHEGKIIAVGTPANIRASRNPYVQQFIGGQRKHYYAIQDEKSYDNVFDIQQLRRKALQKSQTAHPGEGEQTG
jgi:phospholipid/cholesterol/gamma-HCH transport system ATP-binding protein